MLRGISLGLAGVAALIGLVFPFLLATRATAFNQMVLMVMMAGVSGAFIYGVGFRAKTKWIRCLHYPAVTWSIIILSATALIVLRF